MTTQAFAPPVWLEPPESRELDARLAAGKAARASAPRTSHGGWRAGAARADPIDVLCRDDQGRVPQLLPICYGRMRQSPFTFFRGAASIMAGDLAQTPVSGIRTQICGDAHLLNFGAFGTPERNEIWCRHRPPYSYPKRSLGRKRNVAKAVLSAPTFPSP